MATFVRSLFVCAALCASNVLAESAEPLRVMSFNIRYGSARDGENAWPKRKEAVAQTIRDFNPDLLGLQEAEAFQLDYLLKHCPGYKSIGVGRSDGKRKGEFSALFVRKKRFDIRDSGTKWLSEFPDKPGSITWGGKLPRVFTWARFADLRARRLLYVVNTHWDHQSQESRLKSSKAIVDDVPSDDPDRGMPVIVMGDLNAGPDNAAIQGIIQSKKGLRDSYSEANPGVKRIGTFNGFRGNSKGAQIDWIFVNRQLLIKQAGVVTKPINNRYPSDHFPMWAVLEIPSR